jgi:signal peptidase I
VYRFQPIRRGDVVVFWYPKDPSVSFIKRVAGVPGDVVEIRRGVLHVNGAPVQEDYVRRQYRDGETRPPVEVPKGYYYVLGDPGARSPSATSTARRSCDSGPSPSSASSSSMRSGPASGRCRAPDWYRIAIPGETARHGAAAPPQSSTFEVRP